MAFAHISGIATDMDDWYSIIETWLVSTVGWTLESGTGTRTLVFSSDGEAADKTKLFVKIYKHASASVPYYIMGDVMDDAVGTNKTVEGGHLETMNAISTAGDELPFWYAVTADKNAIILACRAAKTSYYWTLYLGLVEPIAFSPPDETYHMIATGSIMNSCSVLRNYNGTWDVDVPLYGNDESELSGYGWASDVYWPVGSIIAGTNTGMIGQLYHIGQMASYINAPNPGDTGVSALLGGTSTWLNVSSSTVELMIRTGGTLPNEGVDDSINYRYTTGTANSFGYFFAILRALLAQVGWNETDFSGSSGFNEDWLFDSTGETGNETVYIRIYWDRDNALPTMKIQDDNTYTPTYSVLDTWGGWPALPAPFHIAADRDCIFITMERAGYDNVLWGGLVIQYLPGVPVGSEYKTALLSFSPTALRLKPQVLRTHDGVWEQEIRAAYFGEGAHNLTPNPNAFDSVAYTIYPFVIFDANAAGRTVVYGRAKYIYATGDSNISNDDTITIGSRVYTVATGQTTDKYCVRSDGLQSYATQAPTVQISAGADDASKDFEGGTFSSSGALTIGNINAGDRKYVSGMVFRNVVVPQGATIVHAGITFEANSAKTTATCNAKVEGYDADDYSDDLSTEGKFDAIYPSGITTASVTWGAMNAWGIGQDYYSPNIASIIEEIVGRGGWVSGNDLVLFVGDYAGLSTVGAYRVADSYDADASGAPKLDIAYTV